MGTRALSVAICWLFLFCLAHSGWADLTSQQAELDKISARINQAEVNLQKNNKSVINISRELASVQKILQQTDQRIEEQGADLKKLQSDIAQQDKLVEESRSAVKKIVSQLEKRLVVLYKEGETGALKILFSADSPTEMARQYHYLSRVLQYDKQLLADYRQMVEEQQHDLEKLNSLQQQKTDLLKQSQAQRQIAEKGRSLQTRLLYQARGKQKQLADELAELKENAARLKTLVARLKQEAVATAEPVAGNFAQGQGQLGWPVNGRVLIGFGQNSDPELGTLYESNGIEIAALAGSPIRAVAGGKVVFSDYFKGYGNLFILSHAGGYHTLYAQTDRMQKKTGDQVSAGDLLGYSGLGGRESIYFEIRANGAPVNPLVWLKQ